MPELDIMTKWLMFYDNHDIEIQKGFMVFNDNIEFYINLIKEGYVIESINPNNNKPCVLLTDMGLEYYNAMKFLRDL